jgi:hypothetical protein
MQSAARHALKNLVCKRIIYMDLDTFRKMEPKASSIIIINRDQYGVIFGKVTRKGKMGEPAFLLTQLQNNRGAFRKRYKQYPRCNSFRALKLGGRLKFS